MVGRGCVPAQRRHSEGTSPPVPFLFGPRRPRGAGADRARLMCTECAMARCADAEHIAVEFLHPVVVGTRALPALALTGDVATLTDIAAREGVREVYAIQLQHLAAPTDIAVGVSTDGQCPNVVRALEVARDLRLLTVALTGGDGGAIAASPAVDHPLVARAADPQIIREVHVTTYHILWELVQIFLERPPDRATASPR